MGAIACLKCGYELSGLATDGVCPECACPVARSLESRTWLRAADPEWLRRVIRGVKCLAISHLLVAIGLAWLLVMMVALPLAMWLSPEDAAPRIAGYLGVGFSLSLAAGGVVWAGLTVVGSWWASAPAQTPYGVGPWRRWVWRLGAVAVVFHGGLTVSRLVEWTGLPAWLKFVSLAVSQGLIVCFLSAMIGALQLLERQTESMTPHLARTHRNVRKNYAGLAILFTFSWFLVYRGRALPGVDLIWMALMLISMVSLSRRLGRALQSEQLAGKAMEQPGLFSASKPAAPESRA